MKIEYSRNFIQASFEPYLELSRSWLMIKKSNFQIEAL